MPFGSNYLISLKGTQKFYNKILGFPLYIGDRVRAYHVMKCLDLEPDDIILDAGCGIGVYSLEYALKGAQVLGVDVSAKKIHQALMATKAAGVNEKASFIIADICNLPVKHGVFDKISCIDVLEHIKKDFKAVDNLCRVLKKSGMLVIHVPQLGFSCSILGPFGKKHNFRNLGHVREGYRLKSLTELLSKVGLTMKSSVETFKRFAGLAWEINYMLRCSKLGSALFPLLYCFSKLDFLSKGKGKGLLVVAIDHPTHR